ncbi:MAG: 3-deoxy-manno-octulosonate-8-phosphatase KdsC [Candidatus Contendobacter odensis]|uniref:3-deoxy-D-manno-octulosonate 8-phosphate phosphatase KdsC n=1 Tax=Candidatus Contendibacter odensensis TaxID=1400860 RepID=A0A2G6PHM8_9GAMM|nr:MAG: 3-deoxy-manno-octulosonate-8-phosphatase KdsC [Candidatus Contendobacter odensis]
MNTTTPDILNKAAQIQLVIFDVDGVFTDGRLYFDNNGDEYKAFHSRDGYGIKMLLLNGGIHVAVISGRRAASVERRMADLGIHRAYLGIENKCAIFYNLLNELKLNPEQVAFVGDDLIDLPVMRQVGLAITVHDADPFVCQHAHWKTPHRGGRGAVRDVCEFLLDARGELAAMRERYL